MENSNRPDIDPKRLWQSLQELAKFGATAGGGVARLAFTDLDRAARSYFIGLCAELGMTVEHDAIGNIFALMPGGSGEPTQASIMVGSHLDTQGPGGRYDGAYGVMCALEVARCLRDHGITLGRPFEIAVWSNEEGARFAPPMMGSGVFAGRFNRQDMLAARDRDGVSVSDEIKSDEALARLPLRPDHREIAAYIEPHIEQGPILETENRSVGIVTGAQAVRWLDITVTGVSAHAGPTPMSNRRDALLTASEIALAVEEIARDHAPQGRATIGNLKVANPSYNVVPGDVTLWVDIRHPDENVLEAMVKICTARAREIARARSAKATAKEIWRMEAVRFDPDLVTRLRTAAEVRGIESMDMVSGAGHDALHLALKCPTAMLFIPCAGGISHNEAESITPEDAASGCQILFDTLLPLLVEVAGNKAEMEATAP